MRKHYPNHEFIDDLANQTVLSISADFSEPLALLEKWADQKWMAVTGRFYYRKHEKHHKVCINNTQLHYNFKSFNLDGSLLKRRVSEMS